MTPPAVDPRRPGLMWPVAIDPGGVAGPTPAQARGPHWNAVAHGLYLPTDRDPALAVDQRIVIAAALLPPGGAVTGWAALRWAGARYLDGMRRGIELPVDVAVARHAIRTRPGVVVAQETALRESTFEWHGLTLTSSVASADYAARHAQSDEEAVALIDRACAADLVSLTELTAWADRHPGARGRPRSRLAVALASENCWSPMETVMRLSWRAMGIPAIACNRAVFDLDGRFLGTPDLLDLEGGVAGEYDGALHLAGAQRGIDVRREGVFRRVGLEYVEMVAADLRDPSDFRRRTEDARRRAALIPAPRQWTIEPPRGWVDTHTVELRRALTDWQRTRFLRWQAG